MLCSKIISVSATVDYLLWYYPSLSQNYRRQNHSSSQSRKYWVDIIEIIANGILLPKNQS